MYPDASNQCLELLEPPESHKVPETLNLLEKTMRGSIFCRLPCWRGSDQLSPICNTSHADGRVLQRPDGVAGCFLLAAATLVSWASQLVTTRPLNASQAITSPKTSGNPLLIMGFRFDLRTMEKNITRNT